MASSVISVSEEWKALLSPIFSEANIQIKGQQYPKSRQDNCMTLDSFFLELFSEMPHFGVNGGLRARGAKDYDLQVLL